jgi:hypothetical protein
MKLAFFESTVRLNTKVLSLLLLLGLIGAPLAARATDTTWNSADYGSSFFGTPPTIDATNFNNTGTWNISTALPYETSHTLNYTNKGTMTGTIGWEFDFGPMGTGGRGWSANFFNDNNATISASDGFVVNNLLQLVLQSHLFVSATNIVNKGLLNAGASGEIVLSGANVNLSHSGGLQITSITGNFLAGNGTTNFVPDTAFYDEYWMATNGNYTTTGSPWDGVTLVAYTGINVGMPCGVTNGTIQIGPFTNSAGFQIGPFTNSAGSMVIDSFVTNLGPYSLTLTNPPTLPGGPPNLTVLTVYSNIFHQGVFVYTGTNNGITGQIRFTPSLSPSNGFCTVAVQLAATFTNVVTAQVQTKAIYIVDSFPSSTNHGINFNTSVNIAAACNARTYRPAAFVLSRTAPIEFTGGFTGTNIIIGTNSFRGVVVPSSIFFYDPDSFTNFNVTGGSSAAYSALIDNVAAQVPAGSSVTNLPGRVRIYAGNLNLNQAHVRAEGQILIQATNLTGSTNAAMDCQNLSYNLGSTSGQLNVQNLVLPSVSRLHGTINMHSDVWSNTMMTVHLDNYAPTNIGGVTNWISSPLTNFATVNLAKTVVDASGLSRNVPVTVQDLVLHSTNIVVTDSMTVDESFLLDGLSATLQGNLSLSNAVQNWTFANAPKLRYFTNNRSLFIPGIAHFGDDGPTNYLAFVNNGSIFAGGQVINSVNLQVNAGINYCFNGGFVGIAQTVQLTGAIINSQSDMQFSANTLRIDNFSHLSTHGTLYLDVTNSLSDGGSGAGNIIACENGFDLIRKPTTGDLLRTTLLSYAPLNAEVDHFWAGIDRGASTAGYTNNVAVGTLALIPEGSQASGYQPQFAFYGTTGNNGLYVSNLDLSMLNNYTYELVIDPSVTIYFVSAILNTNVNITGFPDAAHFLDHQFGDHLRWVGVSSLIKSQPVNYGKLSVNYDSTAGKFQLTAFSAAGQTNFVIQATTDLKNWVPIYTNVGPFGTYTDPNAGSYPYRFYRTVSGP